MTGAVRRYLELLSELVMARNEAGGALPDETESQRVEELELCWVSMTPEQQKEAEAALPASGSPRLFQRERQR